MSNLISAMGKCHVEIATSSRILATEDYVANSQTGCYLFCSVPYVHTDAYVHKNFRLVL